MSEAAAQDPARVSRLQALRNRLRGWGFYLATTLLVDAFLFFDSTVDVRIHGLEKLRELKRAGRSPLLVLWHGQGLMPITTFRAERLCLYASHTRDPNYARYLLVIRWWTLRLIERLGYRVLDASQFKSESRGVMQFVDTLRSGAGSVIAADGPQGPIYVAKPGPAFLAKKSGVLLLPLGVALSGGFHLDQWDRFEVPWPFAQAVICVGEPIEVPARADDKELEQVRLQLETEMNRLVLAAQRRLAARSKPAQQIEGQHAQGGDQSADQQRVEQE
jgi:lysophospholipid acyltransferase (LPLAT)-like uncharacterized protein